MANSALSTIHLLPHSIQYDRTDNSDNHDCYTPILGIVIIGMLLGILAAVSVLALGLGYVAALAVYGVAGSVCVLVLTFICGQYSGGVAPSSALEYSFKADAVFDHVNLDCAPRGGFAAADVMYVREGSPSVDSAISRYFQKLGKRISVSGDFRLACGSILENPYRWSFLFIDLDGLDLSIGSGSIIAKLSELRNAVPFITIVLLSNEFHIEEFKNNDLNYISDGAANLPLDDGDVSNIINGAKTKNTGRLSELIH